MYEPGWADVKGFGSDIKIKMYEGGFPFGIVR